MSDHIVGMMWNKNEGDILVDIIASALENVDTLVIADDGSIDNSWDIIQGFANAHKDQIEHIQRAPDINDKAQRQSLLSVIQERYRPEDTLVQIIESDIMIMDTDIRKAFKERAQDDTLLRWSLVNATIPAGCTWDDFDEYPNWSKSIQHVLTYGHITEKMLYTFRPFKELWYNNKRWRPWPQGFTTIISAGGPALSSEYTPLLAHYGYRGPTHYYEKCYIRQGVRNHSKYPSWDLTSPEAIVKTVAIFNGGWNPQLFYMSRKGYEQRPQNE